MPPLAQHITANMKGLVNSVALAVQLAPSATWGEPLHVSGLFSLLVDDLTDDKVNYDFIPQRREVATDRILQLSAIILTEYILLFSRIAVVDVQVFVTLVAETAKSKGRTEAEVWEVVMSQWWNRVSPVTLERGF